MNKMKGEVKKTGYRRVSVNVPNFWHNNVKVFVRVVQLEVVLD